MNFDDPEFLDRHIRSIMAFYDPRCVDRERGGFYHHFRDDGSIYDPATRHLVSSTRFVFNYAMAAVYFGRDDYLALADHGLRFLRDAHWQPDTEGYAWTLKYREADDRTNHCYGLAFVLLASAAALKAGLTEAHDMLESTFDLMEKRFWLADHGLYADEASPDWSELSPYRGQNANMHSCEALIACFEATGERRYLERALGLADRLCRQLAELGGGLIWEHYDEHWRIDWEYNKDNPRHLFRPWGFQPGHQTEWAKLLLILGRYHDADWLLPKARALFDRSFELAWDGEHGGLSYGVAPDGTICDGDKYFWVQAESFAAAALLAVKSGEPRYWDRYRMIWEYSWRHMVDHQHGAWYRILTPDNRKYDDLKSPAGKTDYHTMGACYEVLRWIAAPAGQGSIQQADSGENRPQS